MNITLKQIKAFLAVAEHGTFSRAALALHISQPALTRLVQEFESSLELRLIERAPNGTRLTPDGEAFRPVVQQLVRAMEESLLDLKQRSRGIRGTVTIALGTALGTALMPSVVRQCRALHPGIKVVLRDDNSFGIVQRVADGAADFGIGSAVGDMSKLSLRPLLTAPLGVIASPAHFEIPARISLADLPRFPIIHHGTDTSIWHILNKEAAGAGLADQAVAVATNLASVLALVGAGTGVAVISALGASGPLSAHLSFTPLCDEGMRRSVFLFTRSAAPMSKAASVVQELMLDPQHRAMLRDSIFWNLGP